MAWGSVFFPVFVVFCNDPSDQNIRLDKILGLFIHHLECIRDLVKALKLVIQEFAGMNSIRLNQTNKPLDPSCTALTKAALKRDIAHAKSPQRCRETDGIRRIQEVYIGDNAVRSGKHERLIEAFRIAAGDDYLVYLPLIEFEDLIHDISFFVADDIRGAVFLGKRHTVGSCADGENPARTRKYGARHSHQTHRADTEYDHAVSITHLGIFNSMKARRHHIRRHKSILDGDIVWHHKQIGIRIVNMIQFRKDTILFCFVIADVSGKGIPAALFMMTTKTMIKDHALLKTSTAEIFTGVNRLLSENNETQMFATAWIGILDTESNVLKYTNTGHVAPCVRQHGEKYCFLKKIHGLFLAGMDDTEYTEDEIKLDPGDVIFLYTDGVTDAHNTENRLYGEQRLLDCLNGSENLSGEDVLLKLK